MISEAVIDSNISHDDFVSINNALKEFYNAKQEIKIPITNESSDYV